MQPKIDRILLCLSLAAAIPLPAETVVTQAAPPRAAAAAEAGSTLTWQTDYSAALAQAKAEKRKVFLFFTGSDWCSWCMRLNKEVLSTPEFARYAKENLVLVELDYPKNHPQVAALKAQNAKLADRYKLEMYPTVVILSSSGKKIDRLGYQEGGPEPFIARLSKL